MQFTINKSKGCFARGFKDYHGKYHLQWYGEEIFDSLQEIEDIYGKVKMINKKPTFNTYLKNEYYKDIILEKNN